MKVTIIGGSAFSTPALFRYLAVQPGANRLSVVLVGRSRQRTQAVERAVRFVCGTCCNIRVASSGMATEQMASAIRGTDIVLIQVRPGGFAARAVDETFPHNYGLCGDEGLGCSGLRAAWRVWPCLQPIFGMISAVCPDAIVILMTAPLGILARAVRFCFPSIHLAPICELPWTTLQKIGAQTGVRSSEIDFDYIGVNHLGWFYRLEFGSRNLLDELPSLQDAAGAFPQGELILACSGVPTSYLRLHYRPKEVFDEQRYQLKSRGATLQKLSEAVMSIYRSGSREEVVNAVGRRATPWYEHAVGPMIMAICTGQIPPPLFLSVQNKGQESALNNEDILEIAHDMHAGAFVPRKPKAAAPPQIHDLLMNFVHYERLATEAVLEHDPDKVAHALTVHPWIGDSRIISSLVGEITANNSLEDACGRQADAFCRGD